ncbi:hypothetical protein OG730_42010 (plasmid) [Streptomyces sp. NBC_01298]|uniref:DUF6624 domain-containing protein n=1 Tax=Streptomyces sp. NBC_01298 TaxID=2903817 RepID=UPI002E147A22|nr:hypothetical protein OG730_42010 [Streptomyces sp. NBC_01298]
MTAGIGKASEMLQAMRLAEKSAHATACRIPAVHLMVQLREIRRTNAEQLREIVDVHGWPTPGLVGAQSAADAVRILLACGDPGFQIRCRNLMKLALDSGELPEILYAYVADTCDVALSIPQTYGTQVNPRTLRPYPIKDREAAERMRADIGLVPIAQQTAVYLSGASAVSAERSRP